MVTADSLGPRFAERMSAALPQAITETFGGQTDFASLVPGLLPLLINDLGDGHHIHLEFEVVAGGHQARSLLVILPLDGGSRLFDLEPADPDQLSDPETQLRVLAEFTEGGEALAGTLASVLAGTGAPASLRVAGASLEVADDSPTAAMTPLGNGELAAFSAVLNRPPGGPMGIVVAASTGLAAALSGVEIEEAAPAAQRTPAAAAPATASAAPPAFTAPAATAMPPAFAAAAAVPPAFVAPATPVEPPVTAHPYSFGQLGAPQAAPARNDRNIDPILDVALQVRVELGTTQMTVEEVLALSPGSVVELDRLAGEPVDIVINNRLIARGEVVVVEENFGVRVTEIVAQRTRTVALG